MNNKKFLAGLLITILFATGITFAASTDTGTTVKPKVKQELTQEQKLQMEEIKALMEKVKKGETLTVEQKAKLDKFNKLNLPKKGEKGMKMLKGGEKGMKCCMGEGMGMGMGKGFGMIDKLTEEEKTALESMSEEQKIAFFEKKRIEQEAKIESHENVIDKLLNGETLTDADKLIVTEIKAIRAEKKAQREEIKTLREKVEKGETLTSEEQKKLDTFKEDMPHMGEKGMGEKGSGKCHGK